jgi:hypothetical protein
VAKTKLASSTLLLTEEKQVAPEQGKTVVVNEGMSKKEEEKLNERLADLEDKVEQENTQQEATGPEPATETAEDQALEAAQDYYAAAAAGNYSYTYDALISNSRSRFTEEGGWPPIRHWAVTPQATISTRPTW